MSAFGSRNPSPTKRVSSTSTPNSNGTRRAGGGGSEDLYVKSYTRPTTSSLIMADRRKNESPADPSPGSGRLSSPTLTFGTRDPLSHGLKPRTTAAAPSFLKYEPRGSSGSGSAGKTTAGSKSTTPAATPGPKIFSGVAGRGKAKEVKLGVDNASQKHQPGVQDYETIKRKCLDAKIMFEDPEFPADDSSLCFSNTYAGCNKLIWKRPKELSDNPKFFVDGASRFDVKQGELGNCWFLAAVGNLTIYEDLLYNVVPKDNTFDVDYCGIFHFRFWQYGKWIDVVVDDRLPCDPISGKLCFMHSYESNEFWGALMEKAYAKIHGTYEALDGGNSNEALQDFCGGIVEVVMVKTSRDDLEKVIETSFQNHSFICCSVEGQAGKKEAVTSDGLVHGHAYTMTAYKRLDIGKPRASSVTLVRIRNPWGSDTEWNGAWSDGSKEWNMISEETRRAIDLKDRKDGEFWMSLDDFKHKFDKLDICNLSPSVFHGAAVPGKQWNESDFEGKWISWATAGGCSNYVYAAPFSYPTNPQFIVEFDTPDDDGDPTKCSVLIGLVQKNRRARRKEGANSLSIGYAVYSLTELKDKEIPNPLDLNFFKRHTPIGSSGDFTNSRAVNARFELTPGKYCIVPSTFKPNEEGEFILRVFSESHNRITENGGFTEMDEKEEDEKKPAVKKTKEQEIKDTAMSKLFDATADEDGEIGWSKLKQLLDSYFKKEFKFNGFSGEVCRSLVALLDKDRSGKIGLEEFTELWTNILLWKNAFKKFDEDHSNNMSSRELRNALKSVGISLSNRTLETLVLRYGNDNGVISFEDFIMCTVKLNAMLVTFKQFREEGTTNATLNLEDWLEKTIYS